MRRVGPSLMQVLTLPLAPLLVCSGVLIHLSRGEGADSLVQPSDAPLLLALVGCWGVGVVVSWRVPTQAAGWAFLGLGTAVAWDAFCELATGTDRVTDSETGRRVLATLADTSFVWIFLFLALAVQLTPPAPTRPAVTRPLSIATVACGGVYQVMSLFRGTPLDPPREYTSSPLVVPAVEESARVLSAIGITGLGLCLVASAVTLVVAWRRARGDRRRQLLWLAAGAAPVAPAVVAAFALSIADRYHAATVVLALAMVSVVAGAALSVLRYRLYEVERIVTESTAYAISSAAVLTVYVTALVVIDRTTSLDAASQLPTIAATLAGVAVARASWVWGRRAVGRRVNPVRFDAVATARGRLNTSPNDLDEALRAALGSHAQVLFPAADGIWVTTGGQVVSPSDHAIEVRRRDAVVARLVYDSAQVEREVVEAVGAEVAAEIENVALRAELARQLELVRESRARLSTAHLSERRRIERDLHDGAQQRLLAIAFRLRSARMVTDHAALVAEADRAITEIQVAVKELRDLAGGLLPAALAGGGLVAAVADLADRSPVPIRYDVVDDRFSPELEVAAWFVIVEAVTNAVKHSKSSDVHVGVEHAAHDLVVRVTDRGIGGADVASPGLQGLADRVHAAAGALRIGAVKPRGTRVEAVFPCGS